MKQIAKSAHILQKVYNLERRNKLFLAHHYNLIDNTDLIFDRYIIMPLFGLSVAKGSLINNIKQKYLVSDLKKQELYTSNTFLITSVLSDMVVYRTKTLYNKRDGLEQIFKYLVTPNHTYNLHISLLTYFLPKEVFYLQILQALDQLQLLEWKNVEKIINIPKKKVFKYDTDDLQQILWGNDEFLNYQSWKRLLKNNQIINMKVLHQKQLSQQLFGSYFQKFHYYEQLNDDIMKLNKYLIDEFDMFQFRYQLEHNEKKMKIYFLRMLRQFELNKSLEDFLKINIKSYSLDWNKQLLKEMKSLTSVQKNQL